jgi:hypothetical protein
VELMAGIATMKAIGPSYTLADRKSAVQRAVNLYMRSVEGFGEDKQVVLDSAPGLVEFAAMPADIRGSYNAGGRWFVVAGDALLELTVGGTYTSRGTLATTDGAVGMKYGRDQIVIVDGPNGYGLTLATNAFAQIVDPDWRGSDAVDELDGYFIFVDPGTDQFYISAIDSVSAFDALDFSSADSSPDNIVTHRVIKRELHLFGEVSTEIWINSGDPDFPFARYNSTPIDVGIVGKRACISVADTLVWVGQTDRGRGYVYKMQGHQPVRISTQAVEEALSASTDLAQCSMWTYHVEGAEFVAVNAPGLSTTWVYEFATGQWHERGEYVLGEWAPLRAESVTFAFGKHYACAEEKIYEMSRDVHAVDGVPMVRERTWPHLVAPSFEPVTYRGLELACTSGHGGNITLEISNDGGFTFGPPLIRSLGAVGRWMQRIRWLMLGAARDRVFRLRCSDAVPLTIHAAAVDS